mmetsp:Transcript_7463/g.16281  ORF Transcript_7463/g.16281 Transcript_7463/m.16281 type:complete len:119 (+) Transcript_7463:113-469(+)
MSKLGFKRFEMHYGILGFDEIATLLSTMPTLRKRNMLRNQVQVLDPEKFKFFCYDTDRGSNHSKLLCNVCCQTRIFRKSPCTDFVSLTSSEQNLAPLFAISLLAKLYENSKYGLVCSA